MGPFEGLVWDPCPQGLLVPEILRVTHVTQIKALCHALQAAISPTQPGVERNQSFC